MMNRTRAGLVVVTVCALAGFALAQPKGEHTSETGKYRVRFPDKPKVTSPTAKTAVGDLTVTIATFANADGSVYLASHTDYPATATKPENHASLLAGVRDGMKGSGTLVGDEREYAFGADKLPAREFTIDKGKTRVKVRLILSGSRLYQVAAIGSAEFVKGKDASLFLDSFEITK